MSDRFYANEPLALGDFVLDGPEAHHLTNVRRFGVGDRVTLFNGDGREYLAEIICAAKKETQLRIVEALAPNRELGLVLHVGAALPKGDRGDFLIEKLTELGATDFTPLVTARSVVQPKSTIVAKLQRAVIEASKQCGRNVLLRVHPPCRIEAWLQIAKLPERKWLAHPGGCRLAMLPKESSGVAVAVGPEGGFTEEEVSAACRSGFEPVCLGPRVLRVETAAAAVAAWVACSLGELPA